jgi:hypothetical protein
VKELFKKLGFFNDKDKNKEVSENLKSDVKEHQNSEKLLGIAFVSEEKTDNLKGCSFTEDK